MIFEDFPIESLPAGAQYYFNVLLINVPTVDLEFEDYWNIEKICDPRPIAYHFYRVEQEEEMVMEIEPNVVIETHPTLGVHWYSMYEDEEDELEIEF